MFKVKLLHFSAVARCQILGGHTVNRDVGYGVQNYINLKILGGHVPVCPPYEYGPAFHSQKLIFCFIKYPDGTIPYRCASKLNLKP